VKDLNDSLKDIYYRGTSLNSFIGDFLYINIILKRYNETPRTSIVRYKFSNLYLILKYLLYSPVRSLLQRKNNCNEINDKFLFTWINIKEYCAKLILPVASKIPSSSVAIVGISNDMASKIPQGGAFLNFASLYSDKYSTFRWVTRIRKVYPKLKYQIGKIIKMYCLESSLNVDLIDLVLRATLFYEVCFRNISISRPKAVITEYDRNYYCSVLVTCANELNISTYTFIHGTLNDKNAYYPFNAKRIFCWGENQRKTILGWGVNAERIIVAGNQKMEVLNTKDEDKINLKRKYGFNTSKPILTLTPNPLLKEEIIKLIETFCKASNEISDINYCVKFHPSDSKINYKSIMIKYPTVKFLDSNEISFKEMMDITDKFVIHNSSIGVEALFNQKNVLVLDVLDTPLYNVEDLVTNNLVEVAKNYEDYMFKLRNFSNTKPAGLNEYVKGYYERTGREAASFIATKVMER